MTGKLILYILDSILVIWSLESVNINSIFLHFPQTTYIPTPIAFNDDINSNNIIKKHIYMFN